MARFGLRPFGATGVSLVGLVLCFGLVVGVLEAPPAEAGWGWGVGREDVPGLLKSDRVDGTPAGLEGVVDRPARSKSVDVLSAEVEAGLAAGDVREERSEFGSVFEFGDGRRVSRMSAEPKFFERDGGWVPIDTSLVAVEGAGGLPGWCSAANSWQVCFGASGEGVGFHVRGDDLTVHPKDGRDVVPVVSGSQARYVDVWPGVDVIYDVSAVGVDQSVVIKQPGKSASEFVFETSGLEALGGADVSLFRVRGGSGSLIFDATADVLTSKGEELHSDTDGGLLSETVRSDGREIVVSVNGDWLNEHSGGEPIVVRDPFTVGLVGSVLIIRIRIIHCL